MPLSFSNNSGLQKVRGKSKIQFKFLWVKLYIQPVNKLPRYWLFFYDVACYSPGHSNKLRSVSHLNKLNKRPTPAGSTSLIEQAIVLLKIMRPKKQLTSEENDHVFFLEKQSFTVPIHEISVLVYYLKFLITPKNFLTGLKEYMEQLFLPMRSSKRNVVLNNSASLNSNRGFWTKWNALPLFILTNFTFVLNWISKEAGAHVSTKEIFSSNSITDITNFTEKRLALTWIPESITRPPLSSCFFEIISPRYLIVLHLTLTVAYDRINLYTLISSKLLLKRLET